MTGHINYPCVHIVNYFTLCKESRFQNQGNFCLYESGLREKFVLESGILLRRLESKIQMCHLLNCRPSS